MNDLKIKVTQLEMEKAELTKEKDALESLRVDMRVKVLDANLRTAKLRDYLTELRVDFIV